MSIRNIRGEDYLTVIRNNSLTLISEKKFILNIYKLMYITEATTEHHNQI